MTENCERISAELSAPGQPPYWDDGHPPRFSLSDAEVLGLLQKCGRRYRIPTQDREDFINHCWLEVTKARASYRGEGPKAFVHGIAYRQALKLRRGHVYETKLMDSLGGQVAAGEQIDRPGAEAILEARVAMSWLNKPERRVLSMLLWEDANLREIAEDIGAPYHKVVALKDRALRSLRGKFGTGGAGGSLLFVLIPLLFLTACIVATAYVLPLLPLREGIGCFLRDAPWETRTLSREALPCQWREQMFVSNALYRYGRLPGEFIELLDGLARVDAEDEALRFRDVLHASGVGERAGSVMAEQISQASDMSLQPPVGGPGAPGVERPSPVSVDSKLSVDLRYLAADFCSEDVGWVLGCDGQELAVVWVVFGRDYFACGISPIIEGVDLDAPFQETVRMPARFEFGARPANLRGLVSLIEFDPGSMTPGAAVEVLATATAGLFTLHRDLFELRSTSSADEVRDFYRFASNAFLGEIDVNDWTVLSLDDEQVMPAVVENPGRGSYFVDIRLVE